MEKQISKITIEITGDWAFVLVQGDKHTIAKIAEFAAKLKSEINTPKEKPLQEPPKTNPA